MIPFFRATSAVSNFVENKLSKEEFSNMKKEIEKMKDKNGKIDFDRMAIRLLKVYKILIAQAKLSVKNAFNASDLDGNGMCSL